jgi:hypothetical protein
METFLKTVMFLSCLLHIQVYEKNAGISGTCSLGMKTDMRVMFAVFYSSIETVYLHTSGKVAVCEMIRSERHL